MDDEIVVDAPASEPVEQTQQQEAKQYTPLEQKAIEQGWRPQDEWSGDPDQWRGAKEFVERGELFGKMDTMGRELKDTRKALKMLQEHHTKLKETEYQRALVELKEAQKKHLTDGNSDAYLSVTETLTDLKAEQKAREVLQQQQVNQPDPRFVAWVNDNKWYNENQDMHVFADTLGQNYSRANPGIDPVAVLEYVTKEVKKRYEDKFENPNRTRPNAVEGGGGANKAPVKKSTEIELTDDERRVMNTFVRQGVMSKEDYIAQVKSMRGNK